MDFCYYRSRLAPAERQAYDAMTAALLALEESARVPLLPMETLSDLFFCLRLDHPQVFYVSGFSLRRIPQSASGEVIFQYEFKKDKLRSQQSALENRLARLLRPMQALPSDTDRLYAIHDFLVQSVRYDKLRKYYSHEIIGSLHNGVGVCEGIAKAFKLLCDRLHIECLIPISEADPENGVPYRHAWNIVRLGGQTYHIDATFDLSLSTPALTRYDYFCLSDRQIFRDHLPLLHPVPACTDGSRSAYRARSLTLADPAGLPKLLRTAIRKKQGGAAFAWLGEQPLRDALPTLRRIIADTLRDTGKSGVLHCNPTQNVAAILFGAADEAILLDQPQP